MYVLPFSLIFEKFYGKTACIFLNNFLMSTSVSQWSRIKGTNFRVIVENEEQVEISFTRMWDPSLEGKLVPLNIDKRFLLKLYIYVLK